MGVSETAYLYDPAIIRTNANYALNPDGMNEYSTVSPFGSMNYDANGNTAYYDRNDLSYDYKNKLVGYDNKNKHVNYQYDALNQRIAKNVDGVETQYYYFGDRVLDEWEYDDEGYEVEYRSFVYGNYIDEVVQLGLDFDLNGGIDERYYYHSDDLFNVMALSNGSGGIAESYDYDEFGKPTTTSSLGNPFLFNGRQYDAESSLYYYRTRYLNPEIGRFISRDTIGIWGDPINLGNGYTYVANNPWTYVDLFGESGPESLTVDYIELSSSSPPTQEQYRIRAERDARSLGLLGSGVKNGAIGLVMLPYTIPVGGYKLGMTIYNDTKGSWNAYHKWWEDPIGDYFRNKPTPDDVLDDVFYFGGGRAFDAFALWGLSKLSWLKFADNLACPMNYLGKVDPPVELLGKNASFGNTMHELISKKLRNFILISNLNLVLNPAKKVLI